MIFLFVRNFSIFFTRVLFLLPCLLATERLPLSRDAAIESSSQAPGFKRPIDNVLAYASRVSFSSYKLAFNFFSLFS